MEYQKYQVGLLEKIAIAAVSVITAVAISYLFYNSFLGALASPIIYIFARRMYVKGRLDKRYDKLTTEFIDALRSISNALLAGYSIENAWTEAEKELAILHGNNSLMCEELGEMNRRNKMSVPLEKSLQEFAERTGLEDIQSFSQVFSFAKRSGGSLVDIIENTTYRISEKHEVKREIQVSIASKQLEQRVMSGIPILMVAYLRLTSPEYMANLYGNLLGVGFMTGCLVIYAGAMYFASKIMDIKV